jgi:hypothetical protein
MMAAWLVVMLQRVAHFLLIAFVGGIPGFSIPRCDIRPTKPDEVAALVRITHQSAARCIKQTTR